MRYLSPQHCVWRTYGHGLAKVWPPVTKLAVHLPNQQTHMLKSDDNLVLTEDDSTLTAAFELFKVQFYPNDF